MKWMTHWIEIGEVVFFGGGQWITKLTERPWSFPVCYLSWEISIEFFSENSELILVIARGNNPSRSYCEALQPVDEGGANKNVFAFFFLLENVAKVEGIGWPVGCPTSSSCPKEGAMDPPCRPLTTQRLEKLHCKTSATSRCPCCSLFANFYDFLSGNSKSVSSYGCLEPPPLVH